MSRIRVEKGKDQAGHKRFVLNLLDNRADQDRNAAGQHNLSNLSQLRQLSEGTLNRGIQEDIDSRLRTAGMTEKKVFSGEKDLLEVQEITSPEPERERYFNSGKHDSISISNKRLVSPQFKAKAGEPVNCRQDTYEQEADQVAGQVIGNNYREKPNLSNTTTTIQRSPAEGETATTTEPASEVTQPPSPVSTTQPEETRTPTPGLIVEDSATELLPGQMKRSTFLAQLRAAVCSTAEAALSGSIWSAMGCPWIDRWFGYYAGRDSQSIERAIQRYTGASGAGSAAEYIPIICSRVQSGIEAWRTTGEVKGAPAGTPRASPEGGTETPPSTTENISRKSRDNSAKESVDPKSVQSQLDTGHSLDSNTKSKMETAFGQDFSDVKIHTDTKAGQLSDDLNARAFTVGKDVAFGSGEYQPGTLIGDALIAHELAHTVQQGGGSSSSSPMQKGETESGTLEEDADTSAVGAMVSLWGGIKGGLADIARNAMPRLRSGLRLQRCASGPSVTKPSVTPAAPPYVPEKPQVAGTASCDVETGKVRQEIDYRKLPLCMADCALEHEKKHGKFRQDECAKLAAIYKKLQEATAEAEKALDDAKKNQTEAAIAKAEAAFKKMKEAQEEFQKAAAAYEKWFNETCRESERMAYQAGIDVCNKADIRKQCELSGEIDAYKKIMEDWEKYKNNPPNCQ